MSTLEERLAGNTSSIPWIPDPAKAEKYRGEGKDCNSDDTLIGVVVDHFTRSNFRGDGLIDVIVLALDGGGEVAVHCGPTVLASQMLAARPEFGDRIGVKYLGERSGRGGGASYIDSRVVTDRKAGGQIRWAGGSDEGASYVEPAKQEVRHESTAGGTSSQDDDGIPFGPSIH